MTLCIQVIIPFNDRPNPPPARERTTKWKTVKVGFPIRRSPDQRVLAPPRSLSQLATSFFASQRQGIRQKPFSTLDRSQQNPCAGMKSPTGKPSRRRHPRLDFTLPDDVFSSGPPFKPPFGRADPSFTISIRRRGSLRPSRRRNLSSWDRELTMACRPKPKA